MKKFTLTTALLLCALRLLSGDTNPAAQQLLIAAKQQASLFHDEEGPLQLDVDFAAQMQVPVQGHLTLKWGAKDRWWRKIVMGDFQQIDVRNGDRLYTVRNGPFTPLRVRQLLSLLQFAEHSEGLLATKQKQHVENNKDLTCLQVKGERLVKSHEVCVNPVSKEIVTDAWEEPPDERRREEYSEYFDFRTHRYPRTLVLLVNGAKVVTAKVDTVTATAFDQALLTPPAGALERRQCENMKRPVPVKTPDPLYPQSASQNRLMGDTTVSMTVLADGSVGDIQLLGRATSSMDEATLKTLKTWKFKPAMCGTEPIVTDIEVVVSFRLQ